MTRKKQKPYWEMTTAELREATKEFDREFVPTRPLTPAMKQVWDRVKRKRGRPRVGQGAAKIRVSMERSLLTRADEWAKQHKMSRSQVIAQGLLSLMRKSA